MAAAKAACLLDGVTIVEHCARPRDQARGRQVIGVRADTGTFSTPNVVLSAGPWSSLIEDEVGRLVQVYPVRGQIVLLETPRLLFNHIVERGKCYMVPRLDGRIVVGRRRSTKPASTNAIPPKASAICSRCAKSWLPGLAGATVVRTGPVLRPGTPDRGPYLGAVPGWRGLWSATGHFRSGLILAPLTGQIITDLIVRGSTPWDIARLAPGREITNGKPMVEDPSGA